MFASHTKKAAHILEMQSMPNISLAHSFSIKSWELIDANLIEVHIV